MQILDKIKKIIEKTKIPPYIYWTVLPLLVLLLAFTIRGCSKTHTVRKTSYQIGREINPQVELLGREKNLMAFTNDLMAAIASENHLRFQWVETNSSHLLDGLDNGSYDFILTALRPSNVSEEHYNFSELLFDLGPVLIVRQDSPISSLKQIQTKPIGISYGFPTNFNALRVPGFNAYNMSFIYYNNMNRALDDLSNDHIDGVIMNAIPAYAVTQGLYANKLKVVTSPLNDEGLRIVSLKSSYLEVPLNAINESLDKMRQNGSYAALIHKWNLIDPQSQFWHTPKDDNELLVPPD